MMLTSGEVFRTESLSMHEVVVIAGIANPMISDQVDLKCRDAPCNGVQGGS